MSDDFELEPWAVDLHAADANFVREFMVDLNAMQALIRCGSSEVNAKRNAHRTLRRPAIAKAIASAMGERAEALGITAKVVLSEAFRSYLLCVEAKAWASAAKFLEMVGKHVDVQAFRTQVGLSDPNGDPLEFPLDGLSTDDKRALLLLLERGAGVEPVRPDEGTPTLN